MAVRTLGGGGCAGIPVAERGRNQSQSSSIPTTRPVWDCPDCQSIEPPVNHPFLKAVSQTPGPAADPVTVTGRRKTWSRPGWVVLLHAGGVSLKGRRAMASNLRNVFLRYLPDGTCYCLSDASLKSPMSQAPDDKQNGPPCIWTALIWPYLLDSRKC